MMIKLAESRVPRTSAAAAAAAAAAVPPSDSDAGRTVPVTVTRAGVTGSTVESVSESDRPGPAGDSELEFGSLRPARTYWPQMKFLIASLIQVLAMRNESSSLVWH